MTVIPCEQNEELRKKIEEYAETLKAEAHRIGDHGLDEHEFYNSGLFRGAIERIRGQFSATMREKRAFVTGVLNYMQDKGYIKDWESSGESNRHDYTVTLISNRICVIELKGGGFNFQVQHGERWSRLLLDWPSRASCAAGY